MKSKNLVLVVLALVVLVLVGLGAYLWPKLNVSVERPYVAVYMQTGDLYFGRISYFPRLALRDVYVLQGTGATDPTQPSLQIVPMSSTVWGPDRLVLNYDQVVFIGKVGADSQVMQAINQGR
ncbi:MAG: hypothetical protein HYS89_01585 [Candidatus Colwellbacteria bacterium]|nr:hypothetical protein [Candidatus Colwellbacteria bacterium]